MRVQPLEPRRVRYPRGPYGWIELKVVTGGVLQEVGSDAAFTYLFLCAVGNRDGVSFWSRQRMAQTLGLSSDATEAAIRKLQERDLIAAKGKVIQVLSLPALGGPGGGQPADGAGIAGVAPGAAAHRASVPTDNADVVVALDEAEIQYHEAEARRRLAKITSRVCSERIRQVARALALEARKNHRG